MTSLLAPNIPQAFSEDEAFFGLFDATGKPLGEGTTRTVFATLDGKYVVKKVKESTFVRCNWTEITAFLYFSNDRDKLARVVSWSKSGSILVMERLDTTAISLVDFEYPTWITDRKSTNVGRDPTGRLKVCDYALVKAPNLGYESSFA